MDHDPLVLLDGGMREVWTGNAAGEFPNGTRFTPTSVVRLKDGRYAVAGKIRRMPAAETPVVLLVAVPTEKINRASPYETQCRTEKWDAFADGNLDLPGVLGDAFRSLTSGNVGGGIKLGPASGIVLEQDTGGGN